MQASIAIPHLKKGQLVREWGKDYTAATSVFTKDQQIALIPVYVNRTPGEKEIAFEVAKQTTLALALAELSKLIDGDDSVMTQLRAFFHLEPRSKSHQDLTTFFFQLKALTKEAKMNYGTTIMRFLTFAKQSDKLYDDHKDEIKDEMDEAEVTALFKKIQPKLIKTERPVEPFIKKEPEDDLYQITTDQDEKYTKLQVEIDELRGRLKGLEYESSEDSDEPEEAYQMGKYNSSAKYDTSRDHQKSSQHHSSANKKKRCTICNYTNHSAETCFKRTCDRCKGKGHSEPDCPSYRHKKNAPLNKKA
jgi:hypothetical protein